MYKSGCRTIFVGFESLDEGNLANLYGAHTKKLKKDYLPLYEEMVNNIQSQGIGVWGAFIAGLDNDTKDIFKQISDFAIKTHLLGAQITVYTPLPGTRLRDRLMKENRLLPTSWDNYTFGDLNIIPKFLTDKELMEGVIETFKTIFSLENRKQVTRYFKEVMKKLA